MSFSDDEPKNRAASAVAPISVECSFAGVRRGAEKLRAFLAANDFGEKDIWACELAFVEGCNNAVLHTPAARAQKEMQVELSCAATHVELRINEYSQGFDLPAESRLPAPDAEGGRGIYLMRALMDHVDYIRNQSSNCLVLKKARTGI